METKYCKKCNKDYPLTFEFWYSPKERAPSMYCRTCLNRRRRNAYAAEPEKFRQYAKKHYEKDPEKLRARAREYAKRNPEKTKEAWRKWYKENPRDWREKDYEKLKANQKVRKSLMSGRRKKEPCYICNNCKVEGHHPDYSRPHHIIWLCKIHHSWVHNNRLSILDKDLELHIGDPPQPHKRVNIGGVMRKSYV